MIRPRTFVYLCVSSCSPSQSLAATTTGQRAQGSSRGALAGDSATMKAHTDSRSQVSWMNLPYTAGWLGELQAKYNIGGATMSTIETNAFCMAGFLQCKAMPGQGRAKFLGECTLSMQHCRVDGTPSTHVCECGSRSSRPSFLPFVLVVALRSLPVMIPKMWCPPLRQGTPRRRLFSAVSNGAVIHNVAEMSR